MNVVLKQHHLFPTIWGEFNTTYTMLVDHCLEYIDRNPSKACQITSDL